MVKRTEVVEDFVSSLKDLCFNSKPIITMLTHVAAKNIQHAEEIFEAIKTRLAEVPLKLKLTVLYLFDSIIKNVGRTYKSLFCNEIVSIIRIVYLEMDQEGRKRILQLRRTWNDVIPINILNLLDINIQHVDPAWLPNLSSSNNQSNVMAITMPGQYVNSVNPPNLNYQQRMIEYQKQLLEIQQRKYELDCREALLKSQHELLIQNTKLAPFNHLEATYEEKRTLSTANTRPIRDPRVLSRQGRLNSAIPSEVQKFPGSNDYGIKQYQNFPSSMTRNDQPFRRGTKRCCSSSSSFSSEEEWPVHKRAKEDIYNCLPPQAEYHSNSMRNWAMTTELENEETKENCSFKRNGVRGIPNQNYGGPYRKMHRISASQAQTRTRWGAPSRSPIPVTPQDNDGRAKSFGIPLTINLNQEPPSNINLTSVRTEGPLKEIVTNPTDKPAPDKQAVDVQELFQKLVSSGMINSSSKSEKTTTPTSSFSDSKVHPFDRHNLTRRQPSTIQALYQGNQCESCGVRFSQEQSAQYKEHLGWHLRQKQKGDKRRNHFPPQQENSSTPTFSRPNFSDPKSLKIRQHSVIQSLYQGQQCSTCGERFPSERSAEYREHLDWHFRQNRKIKEQKVSRQWYCSSSNWINCHTEEKEETNYFEQQKSLKESIRKEEVKISCIPADSQAQSYYCEVCQDKFEEFYNEDEEEWQLRLAIRVEGKIYHPLCYEDQQR